MIKSEPNKVLYRLKTWPQIAGGIHPLGYMYLDKDNKHKWWVFGWNDAWYASRMDSEKKQWNVAMSYRCEGDGPSSVIEEITFNELVKFAEGMMALEDWSIEQNNISRIAVPESWIGITTFEGRTKKMAVYLDQLVKDYSSVLPRPEDMGIQQIGTNEGENQ